jgi:hypothetical protein
MLLAIQPASSGSTSSAKSPMTCATAAPFRGRLSQGTIVSGPAPAWRRAAKPATSIAGAVRTGAERSARRVSMSVLISSRSTPSPPSAARVAGVYSPPCALSAAASAFERVVERPVKAAMPHSAASGAWAVYQAWWARKKLPSPRWTWRTGGACADLRSSLIA